MPADLTREEIADYHNEYLRAGWVAVTAAERLLHHALSEPTRLASARAEGVREGIEMAARWHAGQRARLADDGRYWGSAECLHAATFHERSEKAVRAISPPPPPAEPAQPDDGWIEWKGGECPVEPKTFVEVRLRDVEEDEERGPANAFDWTHQGDPHPCDIIAYRVQPAEPSGMTAEAGDWTVSDTELARDILCYLGIGSDASLEPGDRRRDRIAAMICADRERRALLQGQGGGDAEAV